MDISNQATLNSTWVTKGRKKYVGNEIYYEIQQEVQLFLFCIIFAMLIFAARL